MAQIELHSRGGQNKTTQSTEKGPTFNNTSTGYHTDELEHLNNKLLRSTTWTNKPKIGNTRTTWRMQGRIKSVDIETIL